MKKKIQKLNPTKIYDLATPKAVSKYMSALGKKGGSVKSKKKTQASKENGLSGGRPKKAERKNE